MNQNLNANRIEAVKLRISAIRRLVNEVEVHLNNLVDLVNLMEKEVENDNSTNESKR